MRDRLIELLSENFVDFCHVVMVAGNCKISAVTLDADKFADHLIANGVTFAEDNNVPCKKPMTNGDKIRNMTDEELRDFLDKFRVETYTEPFGKKFCECCPTVGTTEYTECDFVDGVCPHGDALTWWLEQKVVT